MKFAELKAEFFLHKLLVKIFFNLSFSADYLAFTYRILFKNLKKKFAYWVFDFFKSVFF